MPETYTLFGELLTFLAIVHLDTTVLGESDPETLVRKLDRAMSTYFEHVSLCDKDASVVA